MIFIKYLANLITTSRIISSVFMLFTKPLSSEFYFLYTFSGITDMIDGTIARKMNADTKIGAILDSIADIVFLLVAMIKLFPLLIDSLPHWVVWAVISIALIRLIAYIIGTLKFHKFVALHTISNKITGAALFLVPYFFIRTDVNVLCIILSLIAGVSAVEELLIDLNSEHYNPDIRSIMEL